MTLRRLLMAAGGAGFADLIPSLAPYTVVPADGNGYAWTEVGGPRAIYRDGHTYVAATGGNGALNDILVWDYDHATDSLTGPTLLHDSLSSGIGTIPDTHDGPAIGINEDGHLVVAYVRHNGTTFRARVSTNPLDISAWEAEFTWTPISGTMTYPQLSLITSGAAAGRIYLTFRRVSGNAHLVRCHSDDGGATFGNGTVVYSSGTDNEYSTFGNRGDRIDFAITNKHGDDADFQLGYFNMDPATGDLNAADGTLLVADADLPAVPADLTILDAAPSDDYPYSLSFSDDGRPVVAWQTKSADPVEFGEYRWDGSAWVRTVIDTSDPISPSILSVGGGAHDWSDSERFVSAKMVGSELEMFLYRSTDDGASWTGEQLDPIPGVAGPNSPVYVMDAGPELSWLWFDDAFVGSSDFENGLHGVA